MSFRFKQGFELISNISLNFNIAIFYSSTTSTFFLSSVASSFRAASSRSKPFTIVTPFPLRPLVSRKMRTIPSPFGRSIFSCSGLMRRLRLNTPMSYFYYLFVALVVASLAVLQRGKLRYVFEWRFWNL